MTAAGTATRGIRRRRRRPGPRGGGAGERSGPAHRRRAAARMRWSRRLGAGAGRLWASSITP